MPWHCCLLPVARGYPLGHQQLNDLPIRCPSANSFASSFLELLASKLLDCPGDCQATHVEAKQLRHQGPGTGTEASAQKCFKIFLVYMSETFLGRVWGGVPTWFPLWGEHSSSQQWCRPVTEHFTFLWFSLFAGTELTNAFSMCVSTW